jgi:hypothetical protein
MQIENDIEKYFVQQMKRIGALCYKWTSPGTRGVPDRIVLHRGDTFFAELKRPGGKPRKDQLKVMEKFNNQMIPVFVIDTKEKVDEFIKTVQKGYVR